MPAMDVPALRPAVATTAAGKPGTGATAAGDIYDLKLSITFCAAMPFSSRSGGAAGSRVRRAARH